MSVNQVSLSGTLSVRKSYPAREGKKALVLGSIKVEGGYIPVKAFGEAAEALGNANDQPVTISGKLAFDKPKEALDAAGKKVPWALIVIAEKVTEIPPRGHAKAHKEESDIPF